MGKCPKCDYSQDFFLGNGIQFGDVLNLISEFSEKDQEKIITLKNGGQIESIKIENMIVKSNDKEDELLTKTVVFIKDYEQNEHIFVSGDEDESQKFEFISEIQIQKGHQILCPHCKKIILFFKWLVCGINHKYKFL